MPVLATIMRAGIPFHQGFLNYFDGADCAFVSAYRQHLKNEDEFEVKVEYLSSPELKDQTLIIADPMLATGSSMVLVHNALMEKGRPSHIHVAALLASKEGISYVKKNLPKNHTIWVGAIDDELTAQSYIVPGLGDAGDLCYGQK
jgi:uracil phosphoribosyltransferase